MPDLPAGFSKRYGIRMPNGLLYSKTPTPSSVSAEDYWSMPSPVRDMMGMFGFNMEEPRTPPSPRVEIFDRRADAEALLKQLCEQAAALGVCALGATVVEQLCTPFTSGDAAQEFATEVARWLDEQQDGAQ